MAVPLLLTTKLYAPPPRPGLVPRARLVERLDEGLRQGRRLTLVSAPAGFGKTTLLAAWLAGVQRPVVWLSLDPGDDDPAQLVRYLAAALQQVAPSIGRTALDALQSPQPPPLERLLTSLVNDVAGAGRPLVLALDDYHLVTAAVAHRALAFLVASLPPLAHVVVGTREDPPLPLPQLRARGQVTELRERDLRFTAAEAAAFFEQSMGLRLPAATVAALTARTEGWVAGLQLAALALGAAADEPPDPEAFAARFAGDDRFVADYLVAEVLERQPAELRDFLQQTAVLDRLTAPLCDALTGRDDGQAMLERVHAANLFLLPLDNRREWYRYHGLFAEVLRRRLDPAAQRRLHQRAARWHEAQGLAGPAIQHALAAGPDDLADAERLIRGAVEEALHGGRVLTVRSWLDALPAERVRADPALATWMGWALVFTGELARGASYADAVEARLLAAGASTERGELLLLRGLLAIGRRDHPAARELAARALAQLPASVPGQLRWRVIALWVLAEAQERAGSIVEAIATLREAEASSRSLGNLVFGALIESSLASALNYAGQRGQAVAVCEAARSRYVDGAGQWLPVAGLLASRLGQLCYEADELDRAAVYVEQGLALAEQVPIASPQTFCLGLLAQVRYAQGETAAALAALRRARRLADQEALSDAGWLLAWEVSARLREGDLAFGLHWAQTAGPGPADPPEYLRFEEHLAAVRLLLAEARLAEAQARLGRLERFVAERHLDRWLLTVLILQALAAARQPDPEAARERLARAVRLAAPADYLRAFLDEDPRLVDLLPAVRAVAPTFVARLLERAGVPGAPSAALAQPLGAPLSERELEVLALTAAGLANDEIARRLVIAPGTVKRHLNHIYAKLDVGSRTQAVARARALRLLR